MTDQATDDILAEYLRVINKKDTEIHRLLAEKEKLELDLKKKEDKYKFKLRELKSHVESLQSTASSSHKARKAEHDEYERVAEENTQLLNDISTLRSALQKQDDQMKSLLKANAKAQKHESHAREKMESQFTETNRELLHQMHSTQEERIKLEGQLNNSKRRTAELEKEVTRWKVEAQRLQTEGKEAHRAMKELKKRNKQLVPKDTIDTEIAHSEQRYRTIIVGLEKDVERLRKDLEEETKRSARVETQSIEYRHRIEDLQNDINAAIRNTQEADVTLAQERLMTAQSNEELKIEYNRDVTSLKEQVEFLSKERSTLQSELNQTLRKLNEVEQMNVTQNNRFQQEENHLTGEVRSLKQQLQIAASDADSRKRVIEQQEDFIKNLQQKNEAQREESIQESYRVRSEVEHFDTLIKKHEATTGILEKTAADAREQVRVLQAELTEDRTEFLEKEQQWRKEIAQLEADVRNKEEEKRAALHRLEDKVRLLEADHQSILAQKDRDHKKVTIAITALCKEAEDKQAQAEGRNVDLTAQLHHAKEQLVQKIDVERANIETMKEKDTKITRLEMESAEHSASIATLKRAIDSNQAAHRATQEMLESTQVQLDVEKQRCVDTEKRLVMSNNALKAREDELRELQGSVARIEKAAKQHDLEMSEQLEQMKDRVHSLVSELHAAEQQVAMQKLEITRMESNHADECEALRRDVYTPLQEKVESLVALNQKMHRDLHEKDTRLAELTTVQHRVSEQQDTINNLRSELTAKDRRLTSQDDEITDLRRVQRDAQGDRETSLRLKTDVDSLLRKVASLESMVESSTKEAAELRAHEASLLQDIASKRAENSSLNEKVANMESLKAIHTNRESEWQTRERELTDKLEEVKHSHQVLQICFDKQQEQIEHGRRMRDAMEAHQTVSSPLGNTYNSMGSMGHLLPSSGHLTQPQ